MQHHLQTSSKSSRTRRKRLCLIMNVSALSPVLIWLLFVVFGCGEVVERYENPTDFLQTYCTQGPFLMCPSQNLELFLLVGYFGSGNYAVFNRTKARIEGSDGAWTFGSYSGAYALGVDDMNFPFACHTVNDHAIVLAPESQNYVMMFMFNFTSLAWSRLDTPGFLNYWSGSAWETKRQFGFYASDWRTGKGVTYLDERTWLLNLRFDDPATWAGDYVGTFDLHTHEARLYPTANSSTLLPFMLCGENSLYVVSDGGTSGETVTSMSLQFGTNFTTFPGFLRLFSGPNTDIAGSYYAWYPFDSLPNPKYASFGQLSLSVQGREIVPVVISEFDCLFYVPSMNIVIHVRYSSYESDYQPSKTRPVIIGRNAYLYNLYNEFIVLELGCSNGSALNSDAYVPACVACPAGSYSNDPLMTFFCDDCPEGSFSNSSGSANCSECFPGTYQRNSGQSKCLDCEAGWYSSEYGQLSCQSCRIGEYSTKGSGYCERCPAGYTTSGIASTSIDSCVMCAVGTYESNNTCALCPAGSYSAKVGSTNCTECPTGTYSGNTGASSKETCVKCRLGMYANETGSSSCTDCPRNTFGNTTGLETCLPCSSGMFATGGSTECQFCDPGFNYNENTDNCVKCPDGSFSSDGGNCVDCPAGTYGNSPGLSACVACPFGNYAPENGMNECFDCPQDKFCPGGTSSALSLNSKALSDECKSVESSPSPSTPKCSFERKWWFWVILTLFLLLLSQMCCCGLCNEAFVMTICPTIRLFYFLGFFDRIFATKHRTSIGKSVIARRTPAGGFLTISFLFVTTVLFAITMYEYADCNYRITDLIVIDSSRDMRSAEISVVVDVYGLVGPMCSSDDISFSSTVSLGSEQPEFEVDSSQNETRNLCRLSVRMSDVNVINEFSTSFEFGKNAWASAVVISATVNSYEGGEESIVHSGQSNSPIYGTVSSAIDIVPVAYFGGFTGESGDGYRLKFLGFSSDTSEKFSQASDGSLSFVVKTKFDTTPYWNKITFDSDYGFWTAVSQWISLSIGAMTIIKLTLVVWEMGYRSDVLEAIRMLSKRGVKYGFKQLETEKGEEEGAKENADDEREDAEGDDNGVVLLNQEMEEM